MKKLLLLVTSILLLTRTANAADTVKKEDNFYKSDKVTIKKVKFKNFINMKVTGNLFVPKDLDKTKKHPAIVVGHPMGAVKEQAANLYATKMAEKGFVTLSLDLSFWGESTGEPKNTVSPDIYADDFSAAVDFLSTQDFVDPERIGVIGICGSGGFSISAAKIDSRLKAIATISMYDMGDATRNGLKNSLSKEQTKEAVKEASKQRLVEFKGGDTVYTGGTVLSIDENSDPIAKEFYDFYRTPRGEVIHKGFTRETVTRPTLSSNVKFINFYPFNDLDLISPRPLLFIAGEQAHSKYFSEEAYKKASQPKELYIVKGANHVDLYDRVDIIPFDKLEDFFKKNL